MINQTHYRKLNLTYTERHNKPLEIHFCVKLNLLGIGNTSRAAEAYTEAQTQTKCPSNKERLQLPLYTNKQLKKTSWAEHNTVEQRLINCAEYFGTIHLDFGVLRHILPVEQNMH